MSNTEFSIELLDAIYKTVREEGRNAMDVCMTLGMQWGYRRSQRNELFNAYKDYVIDHKMQ
jgi:hypothetical protein